MATDSDLHHHLIITFCHGILTQHTAQGHHLMVAGLEFALCQAVHTPGSDSPSLLELEVSDLNSLFQQSLMTVSLCSVQGSHK